MNNEARAGMQTYTRQGDGSLEPPYEKAFVVPADGDMDAGRHAWADARFWMDIMAEHALFFALLMPPEVASKERAEALKFQEGFALLHAEIDGAGPPERSSLKGFVQRTADAVHPFIEYKARLGEAQKDGSLRSLGWPLFFEHTRHEAERFVRRLENLGRGESELERSEVVPFWANVMNEHARFVAHLLDPEEYDLIDEALNASNVFRKLEDGGIGGTLAAAAAEPSTVAKSLIQNPETDAVMSAAKTILDFKPKPHGTSRRPRLKASSTHGWPTTCVAKRLSL